MKSSRPDLTQRLLSDIASSTQDEKDTPLKKPLLDLKPHFLDEKKATRATSTAQIVRFLTYNFPNFPSVCNKRIAAPALPEDNLGRQAAFTRQILGLPEEEQYRFMALQEIWSSEDADNLEKEFKSTFPFIHRGVNGESCTPPRTVTGGLMAFSRREIYEVKGVVYNNAAVGDELFGKKGVLGMKTDTGDGRFDTFIVTHLHSGDAVSRPASEYCGGTMSHRRSEQMGTIDQETEAWALQSPPGKNLQHRHTFIMGDFNTSLDCKVAANGVVDDRKLMSVSIGGSNNGFRRYQVKYPAQRQLLMQYDPMTPINYLNIRTDEPVKRGAGKKIDPVLRAKAIREKKFVGTTSDGDPIPQNATHLMDFMAMRKDGDSMGELTTEIVSFDTDEFSVSDHFAVKGTLDMSKPFIPKKTKFADATLVRTPGVNPSVGLFNRLKGNDTAMYELHPVGEVKKTEPRRPS